MKRIRIFVPFLLAVLLAACTQAPQTGSLEVTVTGLAAGVDADITVTGPASYSETLASTGLLSELALGTYTIAAESVLGNEAVVPAIFDPAIASFQVPVTADAVTETGIAYASQPGSGRIWVSTTGTTPLHGLDSELLGSSGSPTPTVEAGSDAFTGEGTAVEADGSVWIASFSGALRRYDAGDLVTGGTVAADVTLTSDGAATPSLTGSAGIAFDDAGNLWVANYTTDRLERFTPSQLATNGSPTPSVTLDGLSNPVGIAFDDAGNLWVANRSGATVVAFSPAQQATGGTLTPAVTLSDNGGGSIAEPQGVAFDDTGNLWVTNSNNTTVVRFSPAQLAASGTPTPTATIAAGTFSSTRPTSVAIDHDGSLWVTVYDNGTLNKIDNAAALSGTVTPTVAVEISIGSFDTGFPTFWPTPPGVPIRAP